jgi:peptidoglycan hydrolase CwlO-like protein
MDAQGWATVGVALIALVSAVLSGRSAANASKYSTRTQAETEAYNRARKMDVETIERQDRELEELQKKYDLLDEKYRFLKQDNEKLHEDNDRLRRRMTRLERLEERLKELGYSVD